MSLGLYLAFLGATFLICGTPGPNMLLAMTQGINHGYGKALATMAGTMTGMLLILAISLGGLGALLLASAQAFAILKYIGAIYLIYLGLKTWRMKESAMSPVDRPPRHSSAFARYRTGFLVSLFNPKAILFGVAFFPQFIDSARLFLPQAAILLPSFVLIEFGWLSAYAIGGTRLTRWLKKGTRLRWFNRVSGSAFMGAGIFLGTFRRS
jgi:threonine/homoserine/homoserine lactone efflux protein